MQHSVSLLNAHMHTCTGHLRDMMKVAFDPQDAVKKENNWVIDTRQTDTHTHKKNWPKTKVSIGFIALIQWLTKSEDQTL
jgi:hypothetical protein